MFWAPCGSGGGGWVDVGGGWRVVGGCPPHMCTRMRMHTHARVVNMIISCKWPPPLGESLGIPYDVICVCMCVHACACACMCRCVGGTLSPPTPPPPRVYHRNQSKFNSTWTNQDISIPFEDLKSVKTFPPMGGCMIWWVWVGGWVDGWGQVKSLKI